MRIAESIVVNGRDDFRYMFMTRFRFRYRFSFMSRFEFKRRFMSRFGYRFRFTFMSRFRFIYRFRFRFRFEFIFRFKFRFRVRVQVDEVQVTVDGHPLSRVLACDVVCEDVDIGQPRVEDSACGVHHSVGHLGGDTCRVGNASDSFHQSLVHPLDILRSVNKTCVEIESNYSRLKFWLLCPPPCLW